MDTSQFPFGRGLTAICLHIGRDPDHARREIFADLHRDLSDLDEVDSTRSYIDEGDDLVSAWDILSGDVQPGSNVLVYDDAGDYAALRAAEKTAATGARVEVMTRDRTFSPEVMAMSLTPSMRELQKRDVTFTVTWKLDAVRLDGESSNLLFDALEEWERHLSQLKTTEHGHLNGLHPRWPHELQEKKLCCLHRAAGSEVPSTLLPSPDL